jgi:DNA-directed RNA polymerase I and III subunit RPAC1
MQTESVQYSGAYMAYDVDNSLRMEDFRKNFRVEIKSLNEDDIEFDLIGIDAALANAFRRILIAEVCALMLTKCMVPERRICCPNCCLFA